MRLAVYSHKPCWPSPASPTGYATDGGFPMQMAALSELFEETALVVPIESGGARPGETPLQGHNLRVVPLTSPRGEGTARKADIPLWFARNRRTLLGTLRWADAVHAPIPGDIGTLGMLLAKFTGKPLFVRHCGNWLAPKTPAERFWRWFMERYADNRNVMLATGGAAEPPSRLNRHIQWIFSTTLRRQELIEHSRRRTLPSEGRARLIIVGRQEHAKGTGAVIRSLPEIVSDLPGVELHVVGVGSALEDFKRTAQELGVGDRVRFHGRVGHDEVMDLLRQADAFCFPTTSSEGFPKAVHEALACGLPVITTRVSVLPTLIERGCGILLDDTTPENIASAVRQCFADPVTYSRLSERAIETASAYSLESWRDTIGGHLRAAWNGMPC